MPAEEIRAKTQNREGNHYLIFTPDAYNGRAIFPTIMKFLDRTRAIPNDNTDRSYIIYRLGETYLLAAEAAFKLGDNTNAAKYINVIRSVPVISKSVKLGHWISLKRCYARLYS